MDLNSKFEQMICDKLVTDILAAGLFITVYDGEEYCLLYSDNKKDILDAMASTDADTLIIWNKNGSLSAKGANSDKIGTVFLVYGNGYDIISDWSWKINQEKGIDTQAQMDALVKGASDLAEKFEKGDYEIVLKVKD